MTIAPAFSLLALLVAVVFFAWWRLMPQSTPFEYKGGVFCVGISAWIVHYLLLLAWAVWRI